ncbi:hypothetical protein TWF751_007267 [Orbilia oligospora]|nr:hypothetical protein TWF751_007267 [Orbilia oligospora]
MPSLRTFLIFIALVAGDISATVIKPTACDSKKDVCIKALNSCGNRNRKQVSTDCSKFVWKTVTLPRVTITDTSTKIRASTSTIAYTVTQSTSGGTVLETITNVVTIIPSTVVNVTSPANTPAATAKLLARRSPLFRAMPDLKLLDSRGQKCVLTIPSYARDCGDATRYASACSCFGVPAKVSTIPAKTTTYTKIVTSTSVSLISTAATTVYITKAGITKTTTITSTTSNDANPTTLSLFDLQVFNAPGQAQALYMRKGFGFQVASIDDFLGFILEPNGKLYTPNGRRTYYFCVSGVDSSAPASITNGVYNDPNSPPAFPGQELLCGFDSNQVLSCQCTVAGTPYVELIFNNYFEGLNHGLVYVATAGYSLAPRQAVVTAQAVPFHWDDKCGYHEDENGDNSFDQDCDAAYVDPKYAEDLSDTGGFE